MDKEKQQSIEDEAIAYLQEVVRASASNNERIKAAAALLEHVSRERFHRQIGALEREKLKDQQSRP